MTLAVRDIDVCACPKGLWPEQWNDEDFAVLHVYFDGLVKRLGLKADESSPAYARSHR